MCELILVGTLLAAAKLRITGWPLIGLSLVWAGGVSNWVDRVARGSVIDFLTRLYPFVRLSPPRQRRLTLAVGFNPRWA